MAEIPIDKPRTISRRTFLRGLAATTAGSALLVAEKTGVFDIAEKALSTIVSTGGNLLKKDAKIYPTMPDFKYDIVEYFKGSVIIDVGSPEFHIRNEPSTNNYPIPWDRIKRIGDAQITGGTRQLLVQNPRFVEGIPTDNMRQAETNKWFVLHATIRVLDQNRQRYDDEPMWVYINRGANTAEFVHFPTPNPEFTKGYLDENNNFVMPTVSVISPSR